MVENATGEKTSVKRNGERLGRARRTRAGGSENKTPDTFFTSRSLKNCILFSLHIALALKRESGMARVPHGRARRSHASMMRASSSPPISSLAFFRWTHGHTLVARLPRDLLWWRGPSVALHSLRPGSFGWQSFLLRARADHSSSTARRRVDDGRACDMS